MGKGYKREKLKRGQKKTQGRGVEKAGGSERERGGGGGRGGAEPGAAAAQTRGGEREK